MPAVSLPPKENALFKRILVSLRRRGASRWEGAGPVTPKPGTDGREGGHWATPRGTPPRPCCPAERAPSSRPGGAHLGPRGRGPRASEASVPG